MKTKDSKRALRFQRSRTLRLNEHEDARLVEHTAVTGLSVSEYMRWLFFGGSPIVANRRPDEQGTAAYGRLAQAFECDGPGCGGGNGKDVGECPSGHRQDRGADIILKKLKRRVFNKPKVTMIGELLDKIYALV